jgi:hypothetical protein
MSVEQISVFLENEKGRLHRLTAALGAAGIDLKAASLAETRDYGIFRAVVSDHAKAKRVLAEAGFTVGEAKLVGVRIKDKPNATTEVLKILLDHNISLEYMYAYSRAADAVVLLRVPDAAASEKILKKEGIETLSAI